MRTTCADADPSFGSRGGTVTSSFGALGVGSLFSDPGSWGGMPGGNVVLVVVVVVDSGNVGRVIGNVVSVVAVVSVVSVGAVGSPVWADAGPASARPAGTRNAATR